VNGEFLIHSLSENQIKVYHIMKYQLNQTLAFSIRAELVKNPAKNENINFSFTIQLDIVC